MRFKTFVIGYALALGLLLFAQRHPDAAPTAEFRHVIDLTHTINGDARAYDRSHQSQRLKTVATRERRDAADESSNPQYLGTRLEAPAQFVRGSWTVDQIPARRLVAPLVIIDVAKKAESNPDYQLSVEDISGWEEAHDQIPQGAVVMADTGWGSRWNIAERYCNADAKGTMHFPGYSLDAAKFLVDARRVLGLGIDTLGVDAGASREHGVRDYALGHGLYQIENVANLDSTPPAGSLAVVAPMKVEGGSGAPVRVLAMVR